MKIFLVVMFAADCNGYVFGLYENATEACAARLRCDDHRLLWQQQEPGLCLVQSFAVGKDDGIIEVVCADEDGTDLDALTSPCDKPA